MRLDEDKYLPCHSLIIDRSGFHFTRQMGGSQKSTIIHPALFILTAKKTPSLVYGERCRPTELFTSLLLVSFSLIFFIFSCCALYFSSRSSTVISITAILKICLLVCRLVSSKLPCGKAFLPFLPNRLLVGARAYVRTNSLVLCKHYNTYTYTHSHSPVLYMLIVN